MTKNSGFWIYPILDQSNNITGWGYTEPFKATSKETVISGQDWQDHPFPEGSDLVPGQIGQGHTHPHHRPFLAWGNGYESFSDQDLSKINNPSPAYNLPSYLENADNEIRRRLPGESKDTILQSEQQN